MRIAKTLCITLPPDLLKKAQRIAAREHRSMSELVREALRHYMAAESHAPKSASGESEKPPAGAPGDDDRGSGVLHSFRMTTPVK
jgi:hypothetical protein